MLELDNESKIIKKDYKWLKKYVLGCLLGWIDGKFAVFKNDFAAVPPNLTFQNLITSTSFPVVKCMTDEL